MPNPVYTPPDPENFKYPPDHPFSACIPGRYVSRINWNEFFAENRKSVKSAASVAQSVDLNQVQPGEAYARRMADKMSIAASNAARRARTAPMRKGSTHGSEF